MKLHELSDNPGATKARKRVGRGPGSGTGKTAGRGVKGQKSRSGVAIKGFEGGQMPITRRLPKRGFNNINGKNFAIVNLKTLQDALDRGVIEAKAELDETALVAAGVIRRPLDGVRLLAKGELSAALTLKIAGASKAAVEAVEKAGGKVEIVDVVALRRAAKREAKAAAKA
ncbi:50S ribosomal protein L15 [Pikeienuella piscinae]|uniref:Large ribosomal subunit protein uL15 n=1 Tax=Pikeienuella piscinae TaxID=2748098 RepID=A0A7M3T6G5_9RHOB|nr:50S ribosomal protein L15 [Pikeienuella piscinae]QIE57596.1 50S ribosomal protein L15 [Pikeienuella piscinae]